MESRLETGTNLGTEQRRWSADKLLQDFNGIVHRAQEVAAERAKAADRTVREHPYQTMGFAFGLGLLIGVLATRRS
jgi:ElaB/YqjD/DUF883 family membrane-anchored ribosome-binding protein